MKNNNCPNCQKELSDKANFCGKCKTQVKCLICKEEISLDDLCCESCGADIKRRDTNNQALNKIRYDGKIFDAEFTDTVGKDVTETFGQIFIANQKRLANNALEQGEENTRIVDVEVIDDVKVEESVKKETHNNNDDISYTVIKEQSNLGSTEINYPHIGDIKIKMDFNEKDWIIIYAFYNSENGKNVFSKSTVRDAYKKDRYSKSRMNKFYKNWNNAYKLCFSLQKEGEIRFNEEGIKYVNDLISGKKVSKSTKKASKPNKNGNDNSSVKSNKSNSSKPKKSYSVIDLGIDEEKRQKLRLFFDEKSPKSQENIVLVLGYWLEKIGKIDGFFEDEIYTAIQVVGQRTPSALGQVLRNLKNNGKINLDAGKRKYYFNHVGEDYVKFNLPKVK